MTEPLTEARRIVLIERQAADAARAAHTPSAGEGLDVERLARALDAPGVFDAPVDDAIGLAEDIAREYAALRDSEDGT